MNNVKLRKIAIVSTISTVIIIGGGFGVYKYNKVQAYNNLIITANKCLNQGDYDKAESLFEQSLQYKNDSNIQKNIQLAKKLKEVKGAYNNATKLMNDKKYSQAIDEFKKVTKDDGELFSNAQKNIEECRKLYIAQNMELANAAFKNNKYDEANKYLYNIFKLDANNKEAQNLSTNIKETIKKEQKENSPKELRYGVGDAVKSNNFANLSLKFADNNKLKYEYVDGHNVNGIEGLMYHVSDNIWKGYVLSYHYGLEYVMLTILQDKVIIEEVYSIRQPSEGDFNIDVKNESYDVLEKKFKSYNKEDLRDNKFELPRIQ